MSTRRHAWLLALLTAACHNVTGASSLPPAWKLELPVWSPYMVVQPDNTALGGYRDALPRLTSRSALTGARIQLDADGRATPTVSLVTSLGIDVLGIVDIADLRSNDVEGMFDQYRIRYPQVRTFQIGNEVTTAPPAPITIDQYVAIFARVYTHVMVRYPDVMLVTQAAFGAGMIGSQDLTATIAGIQSFASPSRVVLALNVYTPTALLAYQTALRAAPPPYRVWVTETGTADPASEISYVAVNYPLLQTLPAERIYWYALWAGDTGSDAGFSLINNPTNPPITPGQLFQLLTK
jgi:hypothetical protein